MLALALGLRQGETLGLRWSDVDLDNGYLKLRRNRLRPRYKHGCPDASPCGRAKAGYCPDKVQVRRETKSTKSRAGRRRAPARSAGGHAPGSCQDSSAGAQDGR
ncbi:hypothetical protein GCM10010307_65830 [Streptomyces vastus]|uniref:Tyr recombinase domain-containing protein n=1 Tax=Streptomyces vastus TaxID=285451 RepID=A0ABP6DZN4_9ACTN